MGVGCPGNPRRRRRHVPTTHIPPNLKTLTNLPSITRHSLSGLGLTRPIHPHRRVLGAHIAANRVKLVPQPLQFGIDLLQERSLLRTGESDDSGAGDAGGQVGGAALWGSAAVEG